MNEAKQLSAGALAFVGDAVYGLLVRQKLAQINRPSKDLHQLSVGYVNANAQAKAYLVIEPLLSEEEQDQFKHGRNLHTNHTPKNSTVAEYHAATGLECLFGYLHLSGQLERLNQLFEVIWQQTTNH